MKTKPDVVDAWLGELDRYLRAVALGLDGVDPPDPPAGATLSMRLLFASIVGFAEENTALRAKERAGRDTLPF